MLTLIAVAGTGPEWQPEIPQSKSFIFFKETSYELLTKTDKHTCIDPNHLTHYPLPPKNIIKILPFIDGSVMMLQFFFPS